MDTSATGDTRSFDIQTYDVYFTAAGRRFFFRNRHHGITLAPDHIACSYDGKPDSALFTSIREVHQQAAGTWQLPVHQCEIRFADRYLVTDVDSDAYGVANERQRVIYRDFLRDLHRRLAAHAAPAITFTAGLRQGQSARQAYHGSPAGPTEPRRRAGFQFAEGRIMILWSSLETS